MVTPSPVDVYGKEVRIGQRVRHSKDDTLSGWVIAVDTNLADRSTVQILWDGNDYWDIDIVWSNKLEVIEYAR